MTRGRGKNAPDRSAQLLDANAEAMASLLEAAAGSMPPHAAALMRTVAASDTAARVLKPEDLALFEQYCMAYQVWADARDSYLSQPAATRTREETQTGFRRNSDIDVMTKAGDQMLKLAKQIGLTPVARAQMRLTDAASASIMATAFPDRVRAMFEASHGGR